MLFRDRHDAGKQLGTELKKYDRDPNAMVIGLPRGGVVTAAEVAKTLHLPLDIIVPRKIGAPGNPEFAIGAITEDGDPVLDEHILAMYGISSEQVQNIIQQERTEAARRLSVYRKNRPPLDLLGKTAILVDDGIATGATMRAAILSAKRKNAKKIVVATPVIASDTAEKLKTEADEVVALHAPEYFGAVGRFYETFDQTTDEEVAKLVIFPHS